MRTTLAILMSCLLLAPATAQDWPAKTTRIIVPFGPASTPDMVARLLAEGLQHQTGQVFIVENKPGASGNLGTDAVAKATPDGATLGVSIGGPPPSTRSCFRTCPMIHERTSRPSPS